MIGLGYRLDDGRAVPVRIAAGRQGGNPFASVTEWSDPLDSAHDDL